MKKKILITEVIFVVVLLGTLGFLFFKTSDKNNQNGAKEKLPEKVAVAALEKKLEELANIVFPKDVEFRTDGENLNELHMSLTQVKDTVSDDMKIFEDARCDFDTSYIRLQISEAGNEYRFDYTCTNIE